MKKLPYLLLGCLFLLACEKQETGPEVNFELENIALTGTEAEFRGGFRLSANTYGVQMEEFGAVLTESGTNASRTFLLSEFKQTSAEQVFLVDGLSIGKSYELYLYTRAEGEEWKSEPFAFTTAQPQVHSISSLSAPVGDVLLIKGSSLPLNLEAVSVRFGEVPAKVLRGGMDSLQVEVPAMDFQARSITVSFDSYSHTFEEPFVRNPWKDYRIPVEGEVPRHLFSIGAEAYLIVQGYSNNVEDQLWAFNTTTKEFIQKANFHTKAYGLKGGSLNGKGYTVFLAPKDSEFNELSEYSPETDSWQVIKQLTTPVRRYFSSIFSANGQLYLWRGYDWSWMETYQDFYAYDVENDTYTELATSEKSISGPFFENGEILYAIDKPGRKILGFNEANRSWDELFICPEEITDPAFLPYKDRVYVFSFEQEKTWTYSLTNGAWKEEPATMVPPESLGSWSAFLLDNKGYFLKNAKNKLVLWEVSPE